MRIKNSITVKIIASMSICIVVFSAIGIFTASTLYSARLTQRDMQINEQYLTIITKKLESDIQELQKVAGLCSGSQRILEALRCTRMNSSSVRRKCLDAQAELDNFASSTPLYGYLRRMAVINRNDIRIASTVGMSSWTKQEWDSLRAFLDTEEADGVTAPVYHWYSLLDVRENDSLSFLAPLTTTPGGYLYVELNDAILKEQLLPYKNLREIFIIDETGSRILVSFSMEKDETIEHWRLLEPSGSRLVHNRHTYQLSSRPLSRFGILVGSLTDVTYAGGDNGYILYILVILFFSTAAAGILVTRLLTGYITRPIKILTGHIRKISETNDFSPDPDIEASSDEIGEIGKAVNQMTDHIQNLLGQQARMYEQKKNIEISRLQSQINPHFLYNTLDSIRWMAVIQGSKNIEQTTGALERLLRNMAKGIGDKITLREELELVGNYIYIQQVRYVEIFDYICQIPEELLDCRIIKFTLQPIVENAILHGIEPMKQFGEIEISARQENGDLFISIEDNGVGMTEEELEELRTSLANKDKNALSGIGVSNVDVRLKLHYGASYGLIYESSPGEFTRVTVHIPKEEEISCTGS